MKLLSALILLALLAPVQDDIQTWREELADDAYGNLWDRRDAARDLGKKGTKPAAAVLLEFAGNVDPATREAIVLGIARIKGDPVLKWILENLPKLSDNGRADVIWAFRRMKWEGAKDGLQRYLKDRSPVVRVQTVRTLAVLEDPRCAKAVEDDDAEVIEEALNAATSIKAAVAAKRLQKLLKHKSPRVQGAALRYLATMEPKSLDEAIKPFLRAKPDAKIAAATVAGTVEQIEKLAGDKDWRVRVAAVEGLERLWSKDAIGLLVRRLKKEKGRLRLDIVLTLERMTGKSLGFEAKNWIGWWDAAKATFEMPKDKAAASGKWDTKASFFNVPILSKAVVFIIDASGSMKTEDEIYKGKRKIDVALEELEKAVSGLPKDAKFNVIMLSTEATNQNVRSLAKQLVPASPGNRKKAVQLVKDAWKKLEKIKRGRGDIYDAVLEGVTGGADTIVLLTDGQATDGKYLDRNHIIEALARENFHNRVAVHAVLTGSKGIDAKGMEGIAEVTGGLYVPRK